SGSIAKTRGVHVSDRSTTVSPFAAASSTQTLPFPSPPANTGTASHPARDGANGFFASTSAACAALDVAAVDTSTGVPWSASCAWRHPASASVTSPTGPSPRMTEEERWRPRPIDRAFMPGRNASCVPRQTLRFRGHFCARRGSADPGRGSPDAGCPTARGGSVARLVQRPAELLEVLPRLVQHLPHCVELLLRAVELLLRPVD